MAATLTAVRHDARHAAAVSYNVTITAPASGAVLTVTVGINSGTGARSLSSVTDNVGNTYTPRASHAASSTVNGVYILESTLGAGLPTTLTITFNNSVASHCKVAEWAGLDTTTPFTAGETQNAAQAAGTTASTPTLSVAAAGKLILAAYAMNTAEASFTPDANYTQLGAPANVGNCEQVSQYRLSGTTSEAPGGTVPSALTTAAWGAIVAYNVAAGGTTYSKSATFAAGSEFIADDVAEHTRSMTAPAGSVFGVADIAEHTRAATATAGATLLAPDIAEHTRLATLTAGTWFIADETKVTGGGTTYSKATTFAAGSKFVVTDIAEHTRSATAAAGATSVAVKAATRTRTATIAAGTIATLTRTYTASRLATMAAGTFAGMTASTLEPPPYLEGEPGGGRPDGDAGGRGLEGVQVGRAS